MPTCYAVHYSPPPPPSVDRFLRPCNSIMLSAHFSTLVEIAEAEYPVWAMGSKEFEFIVHSQIFFTINFARPSKIDCATNRATFAPSTFKQTHTHTCIHIYTHSCIVGVQILNIVYIWALSRIFSHPQIGGALPFSIPPQIRFSSAVIQISIFNLETAINEFSNSLEKLHIFLKGN